MEAPAVDLSSDRLETVLEDGEFVLCRSGDAADTTSPSRSVLVVMPRSEHPRPQTVRMLEHEHSLRDELDPAWAVRSLALTTHEGRAALVLEDPGGEPLVRRAGTPMDVGEVLRVGAGLAAALRQLHGRGLIHKDIKPANVMIDWNTGQVWLRGFGIASRLAARAPSAGAAGVHRRHARLHGAGANRLDESVDRRPQRSLRARRRALRIVDRQSAVHRVGCRWDGCTATSRSDRCRRPSGGRVCRRWSRRS